MSPYYHISRFYTMSPHYPMSQLYVGDGSLDITTQLTRFLLNRKHFTITFLQELDSLMDILAFLRRRLLNFHRAFGKSVKSPAPSVSPLYFVHVYFLGLLSRTGEWCRAEPRVAAPPITLFEVDLRCLPSDNLRWNEAESSTDTHTRVRLNYLSVFGE